MLTARFIAILENKNMGKIPKSIGDVGVLILLGPIVGVYRLFFGWWLNDLLG